MIHERIITINGPDQWVKRTLENSLPEGINSIFGGDRSIAVKTTHGEPLLHDLPKNKPEPRFDLGQVEFKTLKEHMEMTGRYKVIDTITGEKIHLLMFDDGSGTGKIEKASFNGHKINKMVDECNGEGGGGGPYFAINVELI